LTDETIFLLEAGCIALKAVAKVMQERLQDFLLEEIHVKKTDRILLAVSGGADSMVMLHLMNVLEYEIEVAHVNFGLRGDESDEDQRFVESICKQLNIKFHTIKFDTKAISEQRKKGIQLVARALRYDWFEEIRKERKCKFTATGHNQTDNIETLLINQLRGSGIHGLTSIPILRAAIIRPMLAFSADEIRDYAKERNVKYRDDSSNASEVYLRNKIRHNIIPVLRDIDSDIENRFSKNSKEVKEWVEILDYLLEKDAKKLVTSSANGELTIPISKVRSYPQAHLFLYHILNKYSFNHDQCKDILNSETGSVFSSENYRLSTNRDHWILQKAKNTVRIQRRISDVGTHSIEGFLLHLSLIGVEEVNFSSVQNITFYDADKVNFPLTMRNWKEGDEMQPLGMKGHKLLSDIMTDAKVDIHLKNEIPIICSNSTILWLAGIRQSEIGKITSSTKRVLMMVLEASA
jgi:tRNA(Ile)-lysidine synthase